MKKSVVAAAATPMSSPIFAAFSCPPDSYCEAFQAPSIPRKHWLSIVEAFGGMDAALLGHRQERVDKMRHEDGTTYNPFDDSTERAITWSLDTLPLPITSDDWAILENGICQRAMLLDQVLADVYGPQNLIKNNKLPAELIFANPGFLRSCHGIVPTGNRFLTYYAADVYRGTDGRFRVLRDYGAQPVGLGYALENRIVISRIFAELYHHTQIRRLAPFFQLFHNSIVERMASRRDDPGIVLLSPGPDSRVYFEHALLSRYLGYPLVEGQDLTVRNGHVYLKKLAGLDPVDAIFRQIHDNGSDPFALRRKTPDGVAGLIQAVREKNIEILNPIGSGFIDTPLLSIFLNDLCQLLRGEQLLLANHQRWWCGTAQSRAYVLEHLSQLRVRSAIDPALMAPSQGSADIIQAIQEEPYNWLASEPVLASATPAWENNEVVPHYCMMRIFACATREGFQVMPGGLAITASDLDTLTEDWPERQKSKDIWVLSEQPVEPFSMMSGLQSVAEFRRSSDLPSRVADNLLWLGRYLERAEGQVRLLRSVFRRLSGEARPQDIPELSFLLSLLKTATVIAPNEENLISGYAELLALLESAIYDKSRPESVVSILLRVQEVARNVRDRLSLDCWRVINHLEEFVESAKYDPLEMLDDALFTLSSFSGLAMESMTRGLGWRFMDMGRRVERATKQVALIQIGLKKACHNQNSTLEALLEVADSIMTYRGRYRTTFQLAPVLDLLIMDETNPKSLAFQFSQLADHVENLPRQNEKRFSTPEERLALQMLTDVRLLDLSEVQCTESGDSPQLQDFLDLMKKLLLEFAQQVTAHYLSRVPSTPHFSIFLGDRDA